MLYTAPCASICIWAFPKEPILPVRRRGNATVIWCNSSPTMALSGVYSEFLLVLHSHIFPLVGLCVVDVVNLSPCSPLRHLDLQSLLLQVSHAAVHPLQLWSCFPSPPLYIHCNSGLAFLLLLSTSTATLVLLSFSSSLHPLQLWSCFPSPPLYIHCN